MSILKKVRVWKSHGHFERFSTVPFMVLSSNERWLFLHTSEAIKALQLPSVDVKPRDIPRLGPLTLKRREGSSLAHSSARNVNPSKVIHKNRVLNERRASGDFEDLYEYESELNAHNDQAFQLNNLEHLDLTEEELLQYVCLLSMQDDSS